MALVQTLDESLADLRAAELGPLAQARDAETSRRRAADRPGTRMWRRLEAHWSVVLEVLKEKRRNVEPQGETI
ncbi:unnamed protein product, partial [Effrenium voratum]